MNAQMRHTMNQLTADKKKLALMILLLVVAVVLWLRMSFSQSPQSVSASSGDVTATASAARPAPQTLLIDEHVAVELTDTLERDLFAMNASFFTPINHGDSEEGEEKSGPEPSDDMTRSLSVRTEAAELELDTTMTGAKPRAMINGVLLKPGDTVEGFKLLRILHRKVVVEKDGVRVLIEM